MVKAKPPKLSKVVKGADCITLRTLWDDNKVTYIRIKKERESGYAFTCQSELEIDHAPLLRALGGKIVNEGWEMGMPDWRHISKYFHKTREIYNAAFNHLFVEKDGKTKSYGLISKEHYAKEHYNMN